MAKTSGTPAIRTAPTFSSPAGQRREDLQLLIALKGVGVHTAGGQEFLEQEAERALARLTGSQPPAVATS